MEEESIEKLNDIEAEGRPYDHCSDCEMSARNGGKCMVYDRYQRLPREHYRGALSLCMKIGGRGC